MKDFPEVVFVALRFHSLYRGRHAQDMYILSYFAHTIEYF